MQKSLTALQKLISEDLQNLEQMIVSYTHSNSPLASKICRHLTLNAGKRIRPTLLILTAMALDFQKDHQLHIDLACAVELIHSATLLHDDVIDHGNTRRRKKTSNLLWGNHASILSGDFLFAKAFEIMAQLESIEVLQIMSETTSCMVAGELKHLENHGNLNMCTMTYSSIIGLKTAKLFSTSCKLGALLANASPHACEIAGELGHHLGLLFQLADDINDYFGDIDGIGKNPGQDFMNKKPTLPIIIPYQYASSTERATIEHLFSSPSSNLDQITPILQSTDTYNRCLKEYNITRQLALASLERLPKSAYHTALYNLTESINPI